MIKHQILLSSSYSEGTRICLDYPDCSSDVLKSVIEKISSAYDGKRVSFSTHVVHTDSIEWESVVEKDPYFDDVRVMRDVDEFIDLIRKDRYLKGMEVARYILSKQKCTHTRIEKLTYICYADYLCATKEKLFEDRVFAFQYGPIIESVYQELREVSKERPGFIIDGKEEDDEGRFSADVMIQMRSRILFSEDGEKKLDSIDRTLRKYRDVKTDKLVDLTHTEGSPWSKALEKAKQSDSENYVTISDDDILMYHHLEECL